MANFGKLLTAMVTPFKPDLSVDFDGAQKLANYLVDNGSESLVVHGTTGESPTLSHEEEYELYRVVKKAVGGRAKIIAGTGSNSTSTTIKSTKEAEKIGCDGVMIVVPYYNKPSQDGMYAHFKEVANNTGLPIIIYNIPGRTGVNMTPETTARLSLIDNIIGLKDASGHVEHTKKTLDLSKKGFTIWSGDDNMTLPMMKVGAVGVISVASHVAGREIAKMISEFNSGNIEKAEQIHNRLMPLFHVLFITSNPTPVKAALEMIGMNVGKLRLPLIEANDTEKAQIRKVMTDLGYIK